MRIYKGERVENKILALASVLALAATLFISATVLAGTNDASQSATTNKATTISVNNQDYSTNVSTITFPAGLPNAVISNPSNGTQSQVLGGAGTAKPVVTLLNSSGGTLIIWYNITTFENGVASGEDYVIKTKAAECANAAAIDQVVSFDANTTATTQITTGAGNEKDLYLKLTLSSLAGKTGTSTLTILGETP